MNTLILDSATGDLLVAALSGNPNSDKCQLLHSTSLQGIPQVKHSESFFTQLHLLLTQVPTFDRIVVGVGPGSYTGTRIAVAAAQALSCAWNIPLMAIPSLYALVPESSSSQNQRDNVYYSNHAGGDKYYLISASNTDSLTSTSPAPLPIIATKPELIQMAAENLIEELIFLASELPLYQTFAFSSPTKLTPTIASPLALLHAAAHLNPTFFTPNQSPTHSVDMPYILPTPYKQLTDRS